MSSDRQEPPEPNLPGPLASLVGRDGRTVLDEDGNPVTIPVTPPDEAVADLPPGTVRRTVTHPDGSVSEQITIVLQ